MKRNLLFIPSVIYVVALIMMIVFLVINQTEENIITLLSELAAVVFWLIGSVCNLIYLILAIRNKWELQTVLKTNLWMKWIHFPVGLLCCAGCVFLLYILFPYLQDYNEMVLSQMMGNSHDTVEAGWGVFFMLLFIVMFIMMVGLGIFLTLQTGMISMAGISRMESLGIITSKKAFVYGLGSCLPIIDVVIAIIMWRKVKKLQG